jgi:hypothetical protein
MPTDNNAESLRQQFPQLEVKTAESTKKPRGKAAEKASNNRANTSKATPTKAKGGRNLATGDTPKSKASGQPEKNKAVELTLPDLSAPAPKKQLSASQSGQEKKSKRPALSPVESEEDDDDDDGGLTVEYPEGNPAAFRAPSQYMPTFPSVTRRFSEFANERESDDDEFDTTMAGGYDAGLPEEEGYAGDEYEEEDEEEPSHRPASPPRPSQLDLPVAVEPDRYTFDDGDEDEGDDGDDALEQDIGDLEAALMREFEQAEGGNESDSSVSEEE